MYISKDTDFNNTNFENAIFKASLMEQNELNFRDANFKNANLSNAHFIDVDLDIHKLKNSKIDGATLTLHDFSFDHLNSPISKKTISLKENIDNLYQIEHKINNTQLKSNKMKI